MSESTRPCEICNQPIDPERIEVVLETRLCVEHARAIQKYGGEFIVTVVRERTSKAGSLKLNYGGVTPHKRRNYDALQRLRDDYAGRQEDRSE